MADSHMVLLCTIRAAGGHHSRCLLEAQVERRGTWPGGCRLSRSDVSLTASHFSGVDLNCLRVNREKVKIWLTGFREFRYLVGFGRLNSKKLTSTDRKERDMMGVMKSSSGPQLI